MFLQAKCVDEIKKMLRNWNWDQVSGMQGALVRMTSHPISKKCTSDDNGENKCGTFLRTIEWF